MMQEPVHLDTQLELWHIFTVIVIFASGWAVNAYRTHIHGKAIQKFWAHVGPEGAHLHKTDQDKELREAEFKLIRMEMKSMGDTISGEIVNLRRDVMALVDALKDGK